MKFLNLRSLQMALLVVAAGFSACKPKLTYVHVKVLPAAAGEPAPITDIELDLDLAGKTSTLHLTDPAHGPIQLPTDVTLEVKTGAGQLAIIAICKNASGAEVDRATGTVTVSSGAIAEASLRLPGGKPDVRAVEAAHEFGSVLVGTSSPTVNATFHNAGFKPTGLVAVALGGVGAGDWLIVTDGCSGTVVPADGDCAVSLQFIPFDVGPLAATLIFSANPGGSPVIALTGTGLPNPQNIVVTLSGGGSGTVTSSPSGLSCSTGTCIQPFDYGTVVTLTPTPATGSHFAGWTGACTGTGACTVTTATALTVGASFTLDVALTVATNGGNGSGTLQCSVNAAPNSACATSYTYGDNVVITATPSTGSDFTGWTGDCTSGGGTCTLNMIAARSVTAKFTLQPRTLATSLSGNGSGSLICSVNLGAAGSCPSSTNYGDSVKITATSAIGSSFTTWAGCTATSANTCTLNMTANKSVTATFASNMCATSVSAVQTYSGNMAGCGAANTHANRANVCTAGAHVCTADEYVEYNVGTSPTHVYWTDDILNPPQGAGTCGPSTTCTADVCFASVLSDANYTGSCGAGTSMAVCTAATDAEGNGCFLPGCGYNSIAPKQFIGGCPKTNGALGMTAGTLCCAGTSKVWYVDVATGSDANAGTSAAPFKTISHALGFAKSQHQIRVKPGTYNAAAGETFPLSVPAGVILTGDEVHRGAGSTPTSIVGCGSITATTNQTGGVFPTTTTGAVGVATGATVAGFTITCASGSGVVLTGNNTNIRTNTITGNTAVGFLAAVMVANGTSGHQIELNNLTGNYAGIWYNLSGAGGKGENNTITANQYGVLYLSPGGDLGNPGSPTTSVGNNTISCNATADLYCEAAVTANVASNKWDHSPPHAGPTNGGGVDIYNPSSACTFSVGSSSVNPAGCVGCSVASTTPTVSTAQVYDGIMAGCGGSVTQATASNLCDLGCHVCSSSEYVGHNGNKGPAQHYWLSDILFYYGSITGSCSASPTNVTPSGSCSGSDMLVVAGVTPPTNPNVDVNGNSANWSHCGYGTNGLGLNNGGVDQFLGGCPTTNTKNAALGVTAGTLCCCP